MPIVWRSKKFASTSWYNSNENRRVFILPGSESNLLLNVFLARFSYVQHTRQINWLLLKFNPAGCSYVYLDMPSIRSWKCHSMWWITNYFNYISYSLNIFFVYYRCRKTSIVGFGHTELFCSGLDCWECLQTKKMIFNINFSSLFQGKLPGVYFIPKKV